jgi:hypothetical protein
MSYYGRNRQGERRDRQLPQVNRKSAIILLVVIAGVFTAYGVGRWIGRDSERQEMENQEVRYEPMATVNSESCEGDECGIRERGKSILSKLRRR